MNPPTMPVRSTKAGVAQRGFTLVEVMVALTIGLIFLTGLSLVFVANGSIRNDIERAGRLAENGTFALNRLSGDLRSAGYYAELDVVNANLSRPSAMPDACAVDTASLIAAMPFAVQGYDGGAGLPPSCAGVLTDLRTGSDVLLVREVDSCVAGPGAPAANCDGPVAGAPYFQSSHCTPTPPAAATELASGNPSDWYRLTTDTTQLTLRNIDCNLPAPTIADYRRFLVHIYFVTNNDKTGDGIPTLKLAQLDGVAGTAAFTVQPIAEGIETLQLEYGLDTALPSTGTAAAYTADPNSYGGCAAVACAMANWSNVVSVKVNLIARGIDRSSVGYTNDKIYVLGAKADGTANTFQFNDLFKRHAYAATIRLYNPSGRRT